jgi:hypothetical protein
VFSTAISIDPPWLNVSVHAVAVIESLKGQNHDI